MRKTVFAFSALLVALLCIAPKTKAAKELIIYDVHGDSPRFVKDDGSIDLADYVRIRNLTDHPYDCTGLYLSDSKKNLKKLPLDGLVLEAGASQRIALDPSWNFALKSSGNESVYLSDSEENILFRYTKAMRPHAPKLSADSGFYDNEFDLKMTVKGNCTIRYTLDGSEPDESSEEYTGPIKVYDRSNEPNRVVNVVNTIKDYNDEYAESVPVEKPIEEPMDKAFIIRAVALDEYGNKSDIITREYFFCYGKYKNIISVVADPEDLFGDQGIVSVGKEYDDWYLNGKEGEEPQVNFQKKGREWEVSADMDYFRGETKLLSQRCGLKLQGRTTRDRRIKNFQLRARNCYSGSDVFEYDIFDNERYRTDGIILDDSFNESFFLSLIEDEPIIKQKTTDRVALFLNGEFWNNIYLRQKIDEKYFEDHFGVAPGNLLVLSESFPEIGRGTDEETWNADRAMYLDIDEFVSNNDLTLESNYEILQGMMDIDSYIEYLAINEWAGNPDFGEFNNDMCWRVIEPYDSEYGDGKIRWIIHDGDTVFTPGLSFMDNTMVTESALYNALMSNKGFRDRFLERMVVLGNTTFSYDNVEKELSDPKWDEPQKEEIREFFKSRKDTIAKLYGLNGL